MLVYLWTFCVLRKYLGCARLVKWKEANRESRNFLRPLMISHLIAEQHQLTQLSYDFVVSSLTIYICRILAILPQCFTTFHFFLRSWIRVTKIPSIGPIHPRNSLDLIWFLVSLPYSNLALDDVSPSSWRGSSCLGIWHGRWGRHSQVQEVMFQ